MARASFTLSLRSLSGAPLRRRRNRRDVSQSPFCDSLYGGEAELAHLVAGGDGRERARAVDSVSPHRGCNERHGCRMELQPDAGGDSRTNPALMEWTSRSCGWYMGSSVRERANLHSWHRVANAGGIGESRRKPPESTVVI